MKPKQLRDRLFKHGRPVVEPVSDALNAMKYLWASYRMGGLPKWPEDIEQEDFAENMAMVMSQHDFAWLVDDKNTRFGEGHGPVALIFGNYDGWTLKPDITIFPWATTRNIIRSIVSFLQMMRYQSGIGNVEVETSDEYQKFYKRLSRYGVLNYAGKIPNGTKQGDKFMFFVKGREKSHG